jgi:Tfp pilus assembly protein PilN
MRQNINLYTDEFKQKKIWLTFKESVVVAIAFFAVIFSYSAYLNSNINEFNVKNELLAKKVDSNSESDSVNSLIEKMREKKLTVESQIKSLTHEVKRKKTIRNAYEGDKKFSVASFYTMFVKISEYSNSELSVDEVGIYDGGREIIINGYSKDKERVPEYLKNLKKEQYFDSGKFGLLNMQRVENTEVYRFEMERRDFNG